MNKQEIHEAIKDYSWIMHLLISTRKTLDKNIGHAGMIAQSGVESTLPKPNNISDPVYQEMLRIEKYDKRTKRLRDKVIFIQTHSTCIKNDKDRIVLDKLLDGTPLREIALELDMSISGVKGRKDNIVHQIYQSAQNARNAQNAKKTNVS
jgi:FixJ family two-component response regulator